MAQHRSALVVALALALVAAAYWHVPAHPRAAGQPPVKPAAKWEHATLSDLAQPIWTTADQKVIASDWRDLAKRLNVPPLKVPDAGPDMIRMAVFNHLSSQGWDLVSHTTVAGPNQSVGHYYTFKRSAR